jgi:hypothetical protein
MTDPVVAEPVPAALPHSNAMSRWRRGAAFVGPAISIAILGGALWQVHEHALDWHKSLTIIQKSPWIWLVLGIKFLTGPVGDWVIFRKLWKIPLEGIFPLIKKMIGNQILPLPYVGEVYFYDWARRHVRMEGSPFGAVKDVAILSAIAGYAMTLIMMFVAWPYIKQLVFGINGTELIGSLAIMLAIGLVITVFRNRVLSLPRRELAFVLSVHMIRVAIDTLVTGVLWSLMLPAVPLSTWLILSTGRLLVTRLPLIANGEIAFADAVTLMHGSAVQTVGMITIIALFITGIQIVVFIAMLLLDLAQRERNA